MAKAFFNGGKLEVVGNDLSADDSGLLFSTVVMVSIAGISLWSFLLLMQAYMVVPGSFGGEPSGAMSYDKAETIRYGRSSVRKVYENLDPSFSHRVPDRIRVR